MTVLTAIKYDGGIIVGADRLVCFENGKRFDSSKLISRKNFVLGLTGRTTKEINLFQRHNPFWSKLDDFLSEEETYFSKLEVFSDFLTSLNLGLKQTELIRSFSDISKGYQTQKYNLQMSFLCTLRFNSKTHFHLDLAMDKNSQFRGKRSILTTPGLIDFTSEYAKSQSGAYAHVYENIKSTNEIYPQFCSGVEIVDFNKEGTRLLYLEHIN